VSLVQVKEFLSSAIEIRELRLRKRREGNGEIYVITLPKAWIKKLNADAGRVKAMVDFNEGLVLLLFKNELAVEGGNDVGY